MLRIACIQRTRVLFVVAAWRGLSELLIRRQELESTGELAHRIAARRTARIERALARAGVCAPARQAVLVPVVADPSAPSRVHASVQVGSIHGADVDDVGLLESAMRRTAAKAPLVTYVDDRSDAHRTAWGDMLGEENVVERAWRAVEALGALPLLTMVVGVALTFYPLVRPLDDLAPWLAIGGLALVAAGVIGSRWHQSIHADDEDDEDE